MKVRRPAAVFAGVADAGERLAARDALPHLEGVKCFAREVPVEREKFQAVAGCVTKDYQRTVVERRGVDRDIVNDAIYGGTDRRAGRGEYIYPKMSGSPLLGRIFTGSKKWRSVEQARLVVAA